MIHLSVIALKMLFLYRILAGLLNDLKLFDASAMTFKDLLIDSSGSRPSPRSSHGVTILDDKLYVFGGYGVHGTLQLPSNASILSGIIEFILLRWSLDFIL